MVQTTVPEGVLLLSEERMGRVKSVWVAIFDYIEKRLKNLRK